MTAHRSLLFTIFFLVAAHITTIAQQGSKTIVQTGIEVLRQNNFKELAGKKVGLITNPTGVDSELKSTIDILFEAPNVQLVALFAPEHGVRGDYSAGEQVSNVRDPATGLPVYSLYGKQKKPAPQHLEMIDVLVYDIQDIGVRSYTYITTMGRVMEAAAEQGIEFMVLDRPNPLGGLKIEGNIAEEKLFSMVGAFPIPYVYGLTCGELAQMINGEGWLGNGLKCKLTVIPMKGWHRHLYFEDTGLPWVPSSPHIPHAHKAAYYVATGILGELGLINIGVGYTLPFELFGAPYINPALLIGPLNDYYKGNVVFRPIYYKPYYGKNASELLQGLQVYIRKPEKVSLMSIQFKFLEVFHEIYPNIDVLAETEERHNMFDKVCGSAKIRALFFNEYKYESIRFLLEDSITVFRELSGEYYLYRE
jgi:uncharacterized protein YbbC (DUF1343 family)